MVATPKINVAGSAARMQAYGTNTPAHCLEYEWYAVGQGHHYLTGGAASAYATFLAIPTAHRHASRNVPGDLPAFLGIRTSTGNALGDVIVKKPGTFGDLGLFVATDYPVSGHIGLVTLAGRERQTGRKFVGYATMQGGYELVGFSTPAGGDITPIPSDPTVIMDESDYNMLLWHCLDNNKTHFWTLVDTVNRVYDQIVQPLGSVGYGGSAEANTWADLYCPSKHAAEIDAARLADGVKGYTRQAWPFPAKSTTGADGTVDLTPVLAGIAGLDTQADAYQKAVLGEIAGIPTATETAAATRAAIIKE